MIISKGTKFSTVEVEFVGLGKYGVITQKREHIWWVIGSDELSVVGWDGRECRAFMTDTIKILEVAE